MWIKSITLENYRNLTNVQIDLTSKINFIVGENNLGKSNLLNAINILFTRRNFNEEDFKDRNKPIEIILTLTLEDVEIGVFEDLFDPSFPNCISIKILQNDPISYLEFYHLESETYITPNTLKNFLFINYDSLRKPSTELVFDRKKGVGRFLNYIIKKYFKDNSIEEIKFIDERKISDLIKYLNDNIKNIKTINDFDFSAQFVNEEEEMISRLISLRDGEDRKISEAGYGLQFFFLISLSILEQLVGYNIKDTNKGIFVNDNDQKRSISLIINIDEPEIHMHPYMQRSLINYLNNLFNNNDLQFSKLIKNLFDIDLLYGQINIVTHSPYILLNDYKQISRFYKEAGECKILSGNMIQINQNREKHLLHHFTFIKEAFFSRCVIICEGESELGAIPLFAASLNINLDDLGISVIKASGKESLIPIMELLEQFKILCVALSDNDNGNNPKKSTLYYTSKKDFEEEIIFKLLDENKESKLREILKEYDSIGENRAIKRDKIESVNSKYHIIAGPITSNLKLADIQITEVEKFKLFYLAWFGINKNMLLGRIIGEKLGDNEISEVFKTVIRNAERLSNA